MPAPEWIDLAPHRIKIQWFDPVGVAPVALAPVVLLHESLGCIGLWKDYPQQLADRTGRRVLAYDRPGFGQSSPITTLPGLDFMQVEADVSLPQLLEALGVQRYVLYGHSVGGPIALTHAAQHAGGTLAVISEAGQAFVTPQTLEAIHAARDYFSKPENLARLARWHGERAQWVLDAWSLVWTHPGFAHWSLQEILPQVSCPTLVVHGHRDEYGPLAFAHAIAQGVRGAVQLNLWPDCGHHPYREHTERTLQTVAQFLAALP